MARTVSNALRTIVNTAVLAALASADTTRAYINLYSATDTLLATLPLTATAGTLAGDGVLTLEPGPKVESAPATGAVSYGKLFTPADVLLLTLPASATSQPDTIFVNTALVIEGKSVELISAVIS